MKSHVPAAVASIALAVLGSAAAQDLFPKADPKADANVARIQKLLAQTIDAKEQRRVVAQFRGEWRWIEIASPQRQG